MSDPKPLEDWEVVEGTFQYHYRTGEASRPPCGYPGIPRPAHIDSPEVNCPRCLNWVMNNRKPGYAYLRSEAQEILKHKPWLRMP